MTGEPSAPTAAGLTRRDACKNAAATALAGLPGVRAAAGVSAIPPSASAAPAAGLSDRVAHPNVLVVFCDQLRIDMIGATGCADVSTPHIDRLFARGFSFDRSYSASPICTPARGSWMTGRMPTEHGATSNNRGLHSSRPSFGQWFADHGYRTAHIGKWHLPRTYEDDIPGFHTYPVGWAGQGDLQDIEKARLAAGFLQAEEKGADTPFLLITSFMQPHDICLWASPETGRVNPEGAGYEPEIDGDPGLPANLRSVPRGPDAVRFSCTPELFSEAEWRYYRYMYQRQIEMLDRDLGVLLDALDASEVGDETVVVFTSDHGEGAGDHGTTGKWHPWESSMRVPLVFAGPGIAAGHRDTRHPASGIDLMPTLCDLAGLPPAPLTTAHSLKPALDDPAGTVPRASLVCDYYQIGRVVYRDGFKLVTFPGDEVELLFDLEADPGELNDLAAAEPGRVDRMRADLAAWEAQLEPVPRSAIKPGPTEVEEAWSPHRGWIQPHVAKQVQRLVP